MFPRIQPVLLVVSGVLLLGGCKKDEPEPQTIPVGSAAASNTPVASDPPPAVSAAPAVTADPAAAATPAPAATEAPATTPRVGGASIQSCCAALSGIASSGRSADSKAKALTASRLCSGLDARVKKGEVTRASAMATIKGTLGSVAAPAECK
ncbi:hypothetical protein [Chondromyces apiculatus]|uniref:Uncharacterized protein n=1 Tax=Chondromyces apiculatus DSM 436 TaxID=1192034 RepID=A0A017SX47_9BACT|nr:hypothetical protein [Chondromyces apiculatus]EYF01352.1 Hypothetical protein CAP_8394 [Chondromyces apiculatus DSM 436]